MVIEDSQFSTKPIGWDTPLSHIIRDDFVMADDYSTNHITLEDALSHRTGLPSHDYPLVTASSPRDAVRRLRHLDLTTEIRATFQYCNIMFTAVSHALETFTGMWLGDFLRTRIWEPLGMNSTYFSLSDAKKAADEGKSLAHAYFWAGPIVNYIEEPWLDIPAISGAGSIISSVVDYAKYLEMMLTYGKPLSIINHIDLRTPRSFPVPQFFALGSISAYALGWELSEYRTLKIFEHQGGVPGFGALMLFIPQQDFAVAIMGNTGVTSNAVEQILKYHLLDELLNVPTDQRYPWKEVMDFQLKRQASQLQHVKQIMYPEALPPGKGLPHSLSLDQYAGIYDHPAYGTLNLTVTPHQPPFFNTTLDTLFTVTQSAQPYRWDFEHVGGEFFLVRASAPKGVAGEYLELTSAYKAEFELGPDRRVQKLGVALVPNVPGQGRKMVWFERE